MMYITSLGEWKFSRLAYLLNECSPNSLEKWCVPKNVTSILAAQNVINAGIVCVSLPGFS